MVATNTTKSDTKSDAKPSDAKSDEKPNAFKVEPTTEPKAEMPRDIALLSDDVVERRIDPFYQTGTMDTSGTGGPVDNSVDAVSPIFAEARRRDMEVATRALDPDDDTPAELVVLPEGSVTVTGTSKTAEEGKAEVFRALEKNTAVVNERAAERTVEQSEDREDDKAKRNDAP